MSAEPDSPAGLRRLLAAAAQAMVADLRGGAPGAEVLRSGSSRLRGHLHHMPELFIQLAGRSRFTTPGGETGLLPGRVLVVAPLCPHRERVAARPFANLVLSLRAGLLSLHLARDGHDPEAPRIAVEDTLRPADPGLGSGILAALVAAPDADGRAAWTAAMAAWLGAAAREAPSATATVDGRVARVLARIHYEIGKSDLSVPALAAYAGCSPDHLTRQFRRCQGESLVGCIQRLRLEQARDLIGTGHGVAEAARLVGIRDPAYFSRIFRRRFGHPPSQHR
ncbi:MAG: hypothetical protein RLZZ127_1495 [Planctomycetota bacterium]